MAEFDARLSAELQRERPLTRMGKLWAEPPEAYFRGSWKERNPLNCPGPFYGAETDTCLDGPFHAPASLLCDANDQGFVWRQPRSDAETLAFMTGASSDPIGGFGLDGGQDRLPDPVRAWGAGRGEGEAIVASPTLELAGRATSDDGVGWARLAAEYREYDAGALEWDLRRYIYFLEGGRYPSADVRLSSLL